MKKLKLNALDLGAAEVLTRAELKQILGGEDGSGGSDWGGCIRCYSSQGYNSCWYTKGDSAELCTRVYGSNYFYHESVFPCTPDCTMN